MLFANTQSIKKSWWFPSNNIQEKLWLRLCETLKIYTEETSSYEFPKSFGEQTKTSKPPTDIFNGPTKILLGYGSRIDYYGPQVERCRLSFLTYQTPEEETLFCSMHLLSYKLLVFVSFALEFVRNPNLLAEILAPCRFFRKISHLRLCISILLYHLLRLVTLCLLKI